MSRNRVPRSFYRDRFWIDVRGDVDGDDAGDGAAGDGDGDDGDGQEGFIAAMVTGPGSDRCRRCP